MQINTNHGRHERQVESLRTKWIVTNPRRANVEYVGSFSNIFSVVLSQRAGCWFINVIHQSGYRVETRIVEAIRSQKIFRAKGRGFWPFFDKANGCNRKGERSGVPSELLSKQNTECVSETPGQRGTPFFKLVQINATRLTRRTKTPRLRGFPSGPSAYFISNSC
jgi:hypothetical protein